MEAGWPGNRAGSVAETIFVMILHEVRAPTLRAKPGKRASEKGKRKLNICFNMIYSRFYRATLGFH